MSCDISIVQGSRITFIEDVDLTFGMEEVSRDSWGVVESIKSVRVSQCGQQLRLRKTNAMVQIGISGAWPKYEFHFGKEIWLVAQHPGLSELKQTLSKRREEQAREGQSRPISAGTKFNRALRDHEYRNHPLFLLGSRVRECLGPDTEYDRIRSQNLTPQLPWPKVSSAASFFPEEMPKSTRRRSARFGDDTFLGELSWNDSPANTIDWQVHSCTKASQLSLWVTSCVEGEWWASRIAITPYLGDFRRESMRLLEAGILFGEGRIIPQVRPDVIRPGILSETYWNRLFRYLDGFWTHRSL
jgi:hypothetical protein